MHSSLRKNDKIDYKLYSSTGQKCVVTSEESHVKANESSVESPTKEISSLLTNFSINSDNNSNSNNMEQVNIDQLTLAEDINDIIDENPLKDIDISEEIKCVIDKLEQNRTQYRNLHIQLKLQMGENYEKLYQREYDCTLNNIKQYIKEGKCKQRSLTQIVVAEKRNEIIAKQKSIEFSINETKRRIKKLKASFEKTLENLEDEEIVTIRESLSSKTKELENISKSVKELIQNSTPEIEEHLHQISKLYQETLEEKEIYTFNINDEFQKRELHKEKSFNMSKMNIELPKFKNYDSSMDIYTFQTLFEKLHSKNTPKKFLPDLLKNNYLEEPALSIVKNVTDISDIWERLKASYGDPKSMLRKKLSEIDKFGMLSKIKEPEKLMEAISRLINVMKDLISLSSEHKIENHLYYGNGIERIYLLLGDGRVTKWLSKVSEDNLHDEELWNGLIEFLEKEVKIQQQKCLIQGDLINKRHEKDDRHSNQHYRHKYHYQKTENQSICSLCDQPGHVATQGPNNSQLIQYFSCKDFVEMTPKRRLANIKSKGLCMQCLFPGAKQNQGKHKDGGCQRDFVCRHPQHSQYNVKKHVLLCEEHKDTEENQRLLETYKSKCILRKVDIQDFSKNIQLSFHVNYQTSSYQQSYKSNDVNQIEESAVYILQTISIDGKRYNLFFDSGCGDLVCRYKAIQSINQRATQEIKGPLTIGGVGNIKTVSTHGIFSVKLPLHNGQEANMSGICLEQITNTFPKYPLQGKVESDIVHAFKKANINKKEELPKLPKEVGGDTDFMIGIKYLRYYPEEIFKLPSGLTIYQSKFVSSDGTRGVIGGPHQVFTQIEKHFNGCNKLANTFLSQQYNLFRKGYQTNPDVSLLGVKEPKDIFDDLIVNNDVEKDICTDNKSFIMKREKLFNHVENAASEISYRCINCRNCKACTSHEMIENISIKEEVEQDIIDRSVKVDINKHQCIAQLPFIHNPAVKLASNKEMALKIYYQQLRKLDKCLQDKNDVINSERKFQNLGYVDYIDNLTASQQKLLRESQQYFNPWRAVWNSNSLSTPCRVVFDASHPTSTGYSLNDILAKGRNSMNKLVEIMLRWMTHKYAFHTDVQKMYNAVQLQEEHWCYQRYIWQTDLDQSKIPQEKVIKTLIYGIRSSGNQAEKGLRETASLSKTDYPDIHEIVHKDIYVDDCLSGASSHQKVLTVADQLQIVLNRGGFSLKGITFSGENPHRTLSNNGESINVAGLKWYSKDDKISLDVSELNFSKKSRGKKPIQQDNKIPTKLTRRHCVSKVSEIYDLTGMITPITAAMKIDLHTLVKRGLSWDDVIPDELRPLWETHFQMMQEINDIRFKRAVIPDDAVSTDINTIDFGDSSQQIACVAIYARFKRKNNQYSCQLVFSRSRLIPDGMSQPRAELYACVLNSHTGEVVRRSFGKHHQNSIKLTDSQIALHWISNDEKPLKQWVRNRVIEIRRFTDTSQWKYITSKNMIADLGTRKGVKLDQINQASTWRNGFDWMKLDSPQFPIKSSKEINLSTEEIKVMKNESIVDNDHHNMGVFTVNQTSSATEQRHIRSVLSDDVSKIYDYSKYIIDPNKHRFQTIIRIVAYIYKFIQSLKKAASKIKYQKNCSVTSTMLPLPTDVDTQNAELYFYRKATCEVKQFLQPNQYERISQEKNGVMYYTGRILPTQTVKPNNNLTDVMYDLSSSTFCVPVVYCHSPIAYSIVNDIHWYHKVAQHSGVETVYRYVLQKVYIIHGRDLVKKFRKNCDRCRYLTKKCLRVAMGPVSDYNLTIAPAFYITQLDIAGPFKSYSPQNKRATIKIWFIIFCCATTSTTSIKVMDDYSSSSFLQSFIRLSCDVGYPKILLLDEGTQLVKGCNDMKLNFHDVRNKLYQDVNVEFKVCPVGGHNMNGKVERKIREVRKSIEKSVHNERLSILQWETIGSEIANMINDLPIGLHNIVGDYENLDLITPNRLKLGRNNDRSPTSPMMITSKPDKIIKANEQIFNTWFDCWLTSHVPNLMNQPKWFVNDRDVKVGDIVLFIKQDNPIASRYQYGMISEVNISQDGKIRKVIVRYRNANENVDRYTNRAVRQIVIVHPVDELSILEEMGQIAAKADAQYTKEHF